VFELVCGAIPKIIFVNNVEGRFGKDTKNSDRHRCRPFSYRQNSFTPETSGESKNLYLTLKQHKRRTTMQELCSLLSKLGQDFFIAKFKVCLVHSLSFTYLIICLKEDLWPELLLLHLHIFQLEWKCVPATSAASLTALQSSPSRSIYSKIVNSLLLFWTQMCAAIGPASRATVAPAAPIICWLLLPLLGSQQPSEVHQQTSHLLRLLRQMNTCQASVEATLSTVCRADNMTARDRSAWESLVTNPALITACCTEGYWSHCNFPKRAISSAVGGFSTDNGRSPMSIPNSDALLKAYSSDKLFLGRIASFVGGSDSILVNEDSHISGWSQDLQRWQSV
jgi:hypothetical protein